MHDEVYDLETYPNCFTACFLPVGSPTGTFFEISERRRDNEALWNYLVRLHHAGGRLIGFNNQGFDYPILHMFLERPSITHEELYAKAQAIIADGKMGNGFAHQIWRPMIPQIDLMRIWHYDNRAKRTSLKALEFAMRSPSVQDLPFPPGTWLTWEQMDTLLHYNGHDVLETRKFYGKSAEKLELRAELAETLGADCISWSDTKIGERFFIRELEAAGVECFRVNPETGRREPLQTERPEGVKLADVIFPYIRFSNPTLADLLDELKAARIYDTRGKFAIKKTFAGLEISVGCGGMHGARPRAVVAGCDILDLDVTSFYPMIAIANRVYPAHLGPIFCDVYKRLLEMRLRLDKKSPKGKAIKLALNSVFGKSNSDFSCMLDPAYMLAITINGQLLVLSLAEYLLTVPGVELLQINTDGLTITIPPGERSRVLELADVWSRATQMPLETADYSRLWMRDCNNYIAEVGQPGGKLKRKGAYEYERDWHQDHGALVIPKAAEAAMVRGEDPAAFIAAHVERDPWDFLKRIKIGAGSHLLLDDGRKLTGLVRYYVSETGHAAIKKMPASTTRLHAGGHADITGERGAYGCSLCDWSGKTKKAFTEHSELEHASKITICNEFDGQIPGVDLRYYVAEAHKLIMLKEVSE